MPIKAPNFYLCRWQGFVMANSGVIWVDQIFDFCVRLLYEAAGLLGTSYEAINVWLFVFILPLGLLCSLVVNVVLWKKLVKRTCV